MEKFIRERVKDNKKLLSKEEFEIIESNMNVIRKIYILSILDVYKTMKDV